MKSTNFVGSGCNTSVADLEENLERNRFQDVVPYDENRVKINNDKVRAGKSEIPPPDIRRREEGSHPVFVQ